LHQGQRSRTGMVGSQRRPAVYLKAVCERKHALAESKFAIDAPARLLDPAQHPRSSPGVRARALVGLFLPWPKARPCQPRQRARIQKGGPGLAAALPAMEGVTLPNLTRPIGDIVQGRSACGPPSRGAGPGFPGSFYGPRNWNRAPRQPSPLTGLSRQRIRGRPRAGESA
jgi:hypothetical protein